MKAVPFACVLCCTIGWCSVSQAGGFFRRLPEVGEWARYIRSIESTFTSTLAGTVESSSDSELTLKCVGEVETSGKNHLWIEARLDHADESWAVVKLLVPEDQVVDGDLIDNAVVIWVASKNYEPYKAPVDWDSLQRDPCVNALLIMIPWTPDTVEQEQERMLTINNGDVQLTHVEIGDLTDRLIDDGIAGMETATGTVTWWPSDEHSFGIVAADMVWRIQEQGPDKARIESRFQLELAATGTDAVSDLPDNQ